MKKIKIIPLFLCFGILIISCNKDENNPVIPDESVEESQEPTEEEEEEETPDEEETDSTTSPFGDSPILMEYSTPVNGEEGDTSGRAVALSGDGGTMAIGSPGADVAAGTSGGLVRVYNHNGGWAEYGFALESQQSYQNFGSAVSLNENGTILAIGDSASGLGGNLAGLVRLFSLQGGAWKQYGNDIYGAAKLNGCGFSISLSASGKRLAVGSPYNDDVANDAGHVRVFDLIGNSWQQVGASIQGVAKQDQFGYSVGISNEGKVVAVSAPFTGSNAGSVTIYRLDGNNWVKLGNTIDAGGMNSFSGKSISLSGDGKTIAIGITGSNDDKGRVIVYEYQNEVWIAKGSGLVGEAEGDLFGNSVSINENGTVLMVGAERNATNGNNSGHAKVFHFKNEDWKQIGDPILGQKGSYQGFSVDINSKGDIVASGAWAWSELDNGSATGQVVTYKIE